MNSGFSYFFALRFSTNSSLSLWSKNPVWTPVIMPISQLAGRKKGREKTWPLPLRALSVAESYGHSYLQGGLTDVLWADMCPAKSWGVLRINTGDYCSSATQGYCARDPPTFWEWEVWNAVVWAVLSSLSSKQTVCDFKTCGITCRKVTDYTLHLF